MSVFHDEHERHFHDHFGEVAEQLVQINITKVLGMMYCFEKTDGILIRKTLSYKKLQSLSFIS